MKDSPDMSIAEREMTQLAEDAPTRPEAVGTYATIKPAFDVATAVVLLILAAPVMLAAMVLVRLTSRGPAIYSQRRMGLHGRVFTIYKIRTMYQDCEARSGVTWSRPGDPRITPVGRVLRFTHLDELPQLINVLLGEMSLVGPRPERPEFLPKLERALPDYRRRLAVRPGVTGLAQVQQPPDTDIHSVRRKLNYDLHYAEGMGLWLDVRIVMATALKCVGVPFAWIGALLMLPDPNSRLGPEPGPNGLLREAELASESLA
jgi:lipopolysaccharide/colanic/teichoic acid biosynthesis glycosyltransferase